jgi:adenosylcobyric acid synthase
MTTIVLMVQGNSLSDGNIWGCYLHEIFTDDKFRHAWLESLGWERRASSQSETFNQSIEALANEVEGALHMELLEKFIWDK